MTNEDAKKEVFLRLGRMVTKEFLEGGKVKDILDFAEYLKESVLEVDLTLSPVESYGKNDTFFLTKV